MPGNPSLCFNVYLPRGVVRTLRISWSLQMTWPNYMLKIRCVCVVYLCLWHYSSLSYTCAWMEWGAWGLYGELWSGRIMLIFFIFLLKFENNNHETFANFFMTLNYISNYFVKIFANCSLYKLIFFVVTFLNLQITSKFIKNFIQFFRIFNKFSIFGIIKFKFTFLRFFHQFLKNKYIFLNFK